MISTPVNTFVAGFIGTPPMNLVDCKITKEGDKIFAEFESGLKIPVPDKNGIELTDGTSAVLGLRAEEIVPADGPGKISQDWIFKGEVMVAEPLGHETHLHMNINGVKLMAKSEGKQTFAPGQTITLGMNLSELHLFDAKTTKVIY